MVRLLYKVLLLLWGLTFTVWFCSCVEQIQPVAGPPDDGIEHLSIIIGKDNLTALQKSTFIDRWFPLYLEKDTGECTARIRMHGGLARHFPKKTYKVEVYSGYPEKVGDAFQLSAQYNDTSFCRYRLAQYLFSKAGLLCPEVKPVHLFFDNCYYGLYLRIEMVDELFLHRRNLPVASLYKAKSNSWFSSKYGIVPQAHFDKKLPVNDMSYADLEQLFLLLDKGITVADTVPLENLLDIHNVLDYYAVAVLIRHYDGIIKNFYLYYNPIIRKFQFIPWDFDLTFYGNPHLTYNWRNNLFEQLMAIDSYSSYVENRMKELFQYDELTALLTALAAEVKQALELDPWLQKENRDFNGEVNELYWYFSRMNVLLQSKK